MSYPTRRDLQQLHCDNAARIRALEEALAWIKSDVISFGQRINTLEGKVLTVEAPEPDRIIAFEAGRRRFSVHSTRNLMECWSQALDHARQHLPAEEVYACCANGSAFKALLICDPKGDFFADADQLPTVVR